MQDLPGYKPFRVQLVGLGGGAGSKRAIVVKRTSVRRGPGWISPQTNPGARPVNVKVITADRTKPGSQNAVRNMIRYAGKEGPLFEIGANGTATEVKANDLAREHEFDRFGHHIIVSPNDGHKITDDAAFMSAAARHWRGMIGPARIVYGVETKPDRAHPDGNRHYHVYVFGVQGDRDLEFTKEMVQRGFRRGASDAATEVLGAMTREERLEYQRQREMSAQWKLEREKAERERQRSR